MRVTPALAALLLLVAGCAGAAPEASTGTPTATDTAQSVAVEYVIGAGELPDDVRSVNATLQVVFVENADDVDACLRETFSGPYKPRPTPIGRPEGDCHRSDPVTVDLTELDGTRSLGRVTAPGSFDAGHALVVTNVTATYPNGTAVTGIRGSEGHRANVVRERPAGTHHVRLGMESFDDRPYDYWVVSETSNATG